MLNPNPKSIYFDCSGNLFVQFANGTTRPAEIIPILQPIASTSTPPPTKKSITIKKKPKAPKAPEASKPVAPLQINPDKIRQLPRADKCAHEFKRLPKSDKGALQKVQCKKCLMITSLAHADMLGAKS